MTRQPNNHTVEENGTFIETHLLSLIETHIPTKMSKSKQTYPWITPEIKKLQRKRDRYYVKAIKSKSPDHWRSFQPIRKQCKDQITNSHEAHLQTLFGDSLKENPIVESKYELMTREPQTNCKKAFYDVFLH